jgi:hypothetical protein
MIKTRLRTHVARAASIGIAAMAASLIVGTGVASAGIPSDPPGGATPQAPHFYNGNVENIRNSGSDTTFFMMQKIGDLYTGLGLYGCTLASGTGTGVGSGTYNTNDQTNENSGSNNEFYCAANDNAATTDVNDNWDRTEVTEGVDDVGSSAGQEQLCGSSSLDSPYTVDFARSSKPAGSYCSDLVETGYAKDGVPILDYTVNPSVYGTSTIAPYSSINGGNVGPVALGWEPGDQLSGPYSGQPVKDISNQDNGGGFGSTAYRIWCASTSATGSDAQINDWGQLTNLGSTITATHLVVTAFSTTINAGTGTGATGVPSGVTVGMGVEGNGIQGGTKVTAVTPGPSGTGTVTVTPAPQVGGNETVTFTQHPEGSGTPVGIPIRPMAVNPSSGTESTFALFANSGEGTAGGCTSSMNSNSLGDPNPATAPTKNSAHVALENNSDQLDQFAAVDFPNDAVDQAIEVATTLYIESNGVYGTNPYAAASTICSDGVTPPCPSLADTTSFAGNKINEDGVQPISANLLSGLYPTARTLFNIYRTGSVRASTAGLINWVCDANVNFQKGLDNTTGINADTELQTLISTTYGFPRLYDESTAPTIHEVPLDGQDAPNTTCQLKQQVDFDSSTDTLTLDSSTAATGPGGANANQAGVFPADISTGTQLIDASGDLSGLTVTGGAGTSTLTLSGDPTGSSPTGGESVLFFGVPPVAAVEAPNS